MFDSQVQAIFGPTLYLKFQEWMYGQTYTQVPNSNGIAEDYYYPDDIRRFLNKQPIVD